jgi:CheY-like chemotaxis protein
MSERERHILFLNVSRTLVQYFPEMYNARRFEGTLANNYMIESVENIALMQPDIILIDIEQGDQTVVWNRIQQLKTHGATAPIPMLLCKGEQQKLPWPESFLHGQGIWLISKPFTRDEILGAVSRIPLARVSQLGAKTR